MTLKAILSKLVAVREYGNGYRAICPIHDDKAGMLTITISQYNRVELHCDSGCNPNWILECIQLSKQDLFISNDSTPQYVARSDPFDDRKRIKQEKNDLSEGTGKQQTVAKRLLNLASDTELFHTTDGDCFASILVNNHVENWPLRSKPVRSWLSHGFYQLYDSAPNTQAVQDALNVLEGKAMSQKRVFEVYTRVAEHDGNIYIDLCDEEWRVVQITPVNWTITTNSPVKFRRAGGMLTLPMPMRGGSINELREFTNLRDEDWPLLLGLIVAMLRPKGPYPVGVFCGEQGSAKSTLARVLRLLIDPNKAPLRSEPRNPRDLIISATNSWIIGLDNLSTIPPWLSDALCRLATGGGFAARQLYSDNEEAIFDAMRPSIITGIEDIATRSDLIDRALIIELPVIQEKDRMTEASFWQKFDSAKGRILGALLDAVSSALKNLPTERLDTKPRLVDFALWATAAEESFGLKKGEFINAYLNNRQSANALALDSSPVSTAVIKLMEDHDLWQGTPTDLLSKLENITDDGTKRLPSWPKAARMLSGTLKRLAPNLRAAGISFTCSRTGSRRSISIEKMRDSSSLPSSSSPGVEYTQITSECSARDMTQSDDGAIQEGFSLSPFKCIETKTVFMPAISSDDNDASEQLFSCDS